MGSWCPTGSFQLHPWYDAAAMLMPNQEKRVLKADAPSAEINTAAAASPRSRGVAAIGIWAFMLLLVAMHLIWPAS